MFDLMSLLIAPALAADVAAPVANAVAQPDASATIMRFMPFFLILVVFYFLLIRPQQKKADAVASMQNKLKKGDKIITNSGLVGVITKLEGEHYAMVEFAKGVEFKVVKSTISGLVDEAFPANQNSDKK